MRFILETGNLYFETLTSDRNFDIELILESVVPVRLT